MAILRRYILFAIIATIANIAAQMIIFAFWGERSLILPYLSFHAFNLPREGLLVSIGAGTLMGLIVKYWLDRRYIFKKTTDVNRAKSLTQFGLYCATAIFTTLLFWSIEIAFHILFQTAFMRYVGAVLGLAVGYTLKFFLDWKFVFREGLRDLS